VPVITKIPLKTALTFGSLIMFILSRFRVSNGDLPPQTLT